jgi:type I restriction enzyme S subunit
VSFPAYPSYRDSGVEWLGAVPSHWESTRVRYVASLNPSKSATSHLPDEFEVAFLPMEFIGEDGSIDLSQTRVLGEVRNGYSSFANGDVVIAKVTPCFENGKGAPIRGLLSHHGFGTTELTVLRPHSPEDQEFIWWLTASAAFRLPAQAEMVGAGGLKRVPDQFVAGFPIAWPTEAERSAIAAFLDRETARIDALIEEQQRLIALLKEKRQAVISHAVTKGLDPTAPMKDSGVEWLGEVPAHWELKRFSRIVRIAEGQVDPRVEPFASMMLIAPNHVEPETGRLIAIESAAEQGADSGKYEVSKGDIVYSKIRPALAKAVMAPLDGLCSADMYPLRGISGLSQFYLKWIMICPGITAWATLESDRVAMPKINREKLKEIKIPVPTENEQNDIVRFIDKNLSEIDNLVNLVSINVDLLKERRSALISAAITGKIDVREFALAELEPPR